MTDRDCPLGEDCDLTTAYMAGAAHKQSTIDALRARVAELEGALERIAGNAQWAEEGREKAMVLDHVGEIARAALTPQER